MLESYRACVRKEKGIVAATLYCVHEPDENQKAQMEQFVRRTYGVNGVEMTVEQQPDLIGGFVLRVGDREFDWSLRGRSPSAATTIDPEVKEMSTISSEEIISILKEKIENYDAMCQEQETGKVISVGDGIATIYGIDHAMYGEIVTFEKRAKKEWFRISVRIPSDVSCSVKIQESKKVPVCTYEKESRNPGR